MNYVGYITVLLNGFTDSVTQNIYLLHLCNESTDVNRINVLIKNILFIKTFISIKIMLYSMPVSIAQLVDANSITMRSVRSPAIN